MRAFFYAYDWQIKMVGTVNNYRNNGHHNWDLG